MEFLNPAALYALFLLPLLLIPYLIKGRPRRLVFSSLLLFRDLSSRSRARPWGTLRLPPIFFLQLLLLLLLILALGEPVFSVRPLKVAVVFDNSASMQALEGERSRFELAQDEAAALIRGLPARARIDLFALTPSLEQIGRDGMGPGEVLDLVAGLKPYDLGEPLVDYGDELSRFARSKNYERVFFLTDHPVQGHSTALKAISVGRPRGNLAITAFRISPGSVASPRLDARIEVTSFSSSQESFRLSLKGGGKVLATRNEKIGPREKMTASFEGIPFHPYYEAELQVADALALDNHRFAVPPPARGLEILAVSPRPQALYSLRSIPGVNLKVVSPEAYENERNKNYSLEIFHFSSPDIPPRRHALFVLPPRENPLVGVGKALGQVQISAWKEPHPLTRYINFALFRPSYARALNPLGSGQMIIESPEGPLAVALEDRGFRYLVLGFDPFPYLGQKNLPVSIFTLNFLSWFYNGLSGEGIATGRPIEARTGYEGGMVLTPGGEKFPIAGEGRFYRTGFQGIYQLVRNEKKEFIAVNLEDNRESDLMDPVPIKLREEPEGTRSVSVPFSLWPYLLLLSLFLLLLEWFFNPPVARADRLDYGRAGRKS